jgi:hypothetical protein
MIVELNSGDERALAAWLRQQADGLSDIVRRLSVAWCSGVFAGGPYGLKVAALAGQSGAVASSLSTTGGQLVNTAGDLDDVAGNVDAADGGSPPALSPFIDPGGPDHRLDQSKEWDLITWWRRDGQPLPGGFTWDGFGGVRAVASMGDSHYNSDQVYLAPSLTLFAGIMASVNRRFETPGGTLDLNAEGAAGVEDQFSGDADVSRGGAQLGESEAVAVGPFGDASAAYNTNNFGVQVTGEAGLRESETASVGLSADRGGSDDLLHVDVRDQEVLGAGVDVWVRLPEVQPSELLPPPPPDPVPNPEPAIAAWLRRLQEEGGKEAPNPPGTNPPWHWPPSDEPKPKIGWPDPWLHPGLVPAW